MAVNLSPVGGVAAQFFTNTGAVLTGGKLYTYLAGTTTPATTYTTSAGNVARTNPIVLDAAGRVPGGGEIWLNASVVYKFVLTDSNDVLIGTYDNISASVSTDASLVTYNPAGTGAVPTTVQARLRQIVNVVDFGNVGATALALAFNFADEVVVNTPINVDSNVTIAHDKNIRFEGNGALIVGAGVVLTLNAKIIADDVWIFQGAGKVVATSMYHNNYPIKATNRNDVIRAAWFGVVGDATYRTFYSPAGSPAGTNIIGEAPVATDSTPYMKAALLYAQQAGVKGQAYNYAEQTPKIVLPEGIIFVQGNNPFGSQLFTSELLDAYAAASAGTLTVLSDEIKWGCHMVIVEGVNSVVMWKPLQVSDKFCHAYHICTRVAFKDFVVQCMIPENQTMGTFFYNIAYGLRGTIANYENALGDVKCERVWVVQSSNGGKSQPNGVVFAQIEKIFHFEGYSRADQIQTENCKFYGFKFGVRCDNPESVVHNFVNTWWEPGRLSGPKIVFDYAAFFGGFSARGCYFALKGSDIRLLRTLNATDLYIGNSLFADACFDFIDGNRMEGGAGENNLVLYEGFNGHANFNGLKVSYGGSHVSGSDVVLTGTATAYFNNCNVLGTTVIRDTYTGQRDAVTYENCVPNIAVFPDIILGTAEYFYGIYNNPFPVAIPSVRFINCTGENNLPLPERYGTFNRTARDLTSSYLGRAGNTGGVAMRIGQPSTTYPNLLVSVGVPRCVVIEDVRLSNTSHSTGTFDGIRFEFIPTTGPTYSFDVVLTGAAQQNVSVIPSGQWITTGRFAASIKVTFLLAGAPIATQSHPGNLELRYRPILTQRSDIASPFSENVSLITPSYF
jgi:hypothetical protein